MNIMRKLRGAGGTSAPSTNDLNDGSSAPSSSTHTQLGLMHLKKLFSEYTHPPHPLTEQEKDDKLYNMLPLFCKVSLMSNNNMLCSKYSVMIDFPFFVISFLEKIKLFCNYISYKACHLIALKCHFNFDNLTFKYYYIYKKT